MSRLRYNSTLSTAADGRCTARIWLYFTRKPDQYLEQTFTSYAEAEAWRDPIIAAHN